MNKSEQIRKLVEANPTLSKKRLGEMAFEKGYANSAESGRKVVGNVTTWATTTRKQTDTYIGPRLGPGEKFDNSPYILTAKKIGLIYDVHIPFHADIELKMALSWLKDQEIDCLVLGGDIVDCFDLSRFERDLDSRGFWNEIKMLTDFLDDLRDNFPTQKIIYKFGNHETRYKRYLLKQARELSIPINSIEYLIKQEIIKCEDCTGFECTNCGGIQWTIKNKDRNIIVVGDQRPIHAGKLDIIHGHESVGGAGGVSPARSFMLKRKVNTIGGHFHRSSKQTSKDARGSRSASWSVGCLCDLTPKYLPQNEWGHGFAMVELEDDVFTVHNKEIINGRVV